MSVFQPIIYTRPFRHNVMDYCYFVLPEILHKREYLAVVNRHVKNVLAVECGRGSIRGNRWHLFRFDDYILVGIATESFGRHDETGVPIRGYYGLLMTAQDAYIPSVEFFRELDVKFVEPHFNDYKNFDVAYVHDLGMQNRSEIDSRSSEIKEHEISFNLDPNKVMFLSDVTSPSCYLMRAIDVAKCNKNFEFVFGFNTEEHALELPVMNVVCYGTRSKLVALHKQRVESGVHQRNTSGPKVFTSQRDATAKNGSCFHGAAYKAVHDDLQSQASPSSRIREFGIEYAEEDECVLTDIIQGIINTLVWVDSHINHRERGKEIKIYKRDVGFGYAGHTNSVHDSPSKTSEGKSPDYTFGMSIQDT